VDFKRSQRVVSGPGGLFRVTLRYKPQKARKGGFPDTKWEVRTLHALSRFLRFVLANEARYRTYVELPEALRDFVGEVESLERDVQSPARSSVSATRGKEIG